MQGGTFILVRQGPLRFCVFRLFAAISWAQHSAKGARSSSGGLRTSGHYPLSEMARINVLNQAEVSPPASFPPLGRERG